MEVEHALEIGAHRIVGRQQIDGDGFDAVLLKFFRRTRCAEKYL